MAILLAKRVTKWPNKDLLLHIPIFVNWLGTHDRASCRLRERRRIDCLACSLGLVAEAFWGETTKELDKSVDSFWNDCCNTFWGARARKKKAGPSDYEAGSSPDSFLFYLLREVREQAESAPSYVTLPSLLRAHLSTLTPGAVPSKPWNGSSPFAPNSLCTPTLGNQVLQARIRAGRTTLSDLVSSKAKTTPFRSEITSN